VNAANAIRNGNNGTLRPGFSTQIQVLNLALDQLADLRRIQLHLENS
jgi:hypothetical protein